MREELHFIYKTLQQGKRSEKALLIFLAIVAILGILALMIKPSWDEFGGLCGTLAMGFFYAEAVYRRVGMGWLRSELKAVTDKAYDIQDEVFRLREENQRLDYAVALLT